MAIGNKKPSNLTEILNSITYNKNDFLETNEESVYDPFIINRMLSYDRGTIMYAQEMNERSTLTRKMQYEYLLASVRKKKRFFPYRKKSKVSDNIEIIKEYYSCSTKRAIEYAEQLTEEEIKKISEYLNAKGGCDELNIRRKVK